MNHGLKFPSNERIVDQPHKQHRRHTLTELVPSQLQDETLRTLQCGANSSIEEKGTG